MKILLLLFCLLASALAQSKEEDEIKSLPGLPFDPGFKMYSGFLNASEGHHFFYWFVESQNSVAEDPLALWLTGGPGCSSLGGMLEEMGPFRPNPSAKTLYENRYTWNKAANYLFLESPVGVGFSYADDGNIKTSDDIVSEDNYQALLSFYARFPEYNNRSLFITGESYGGIYLPTLATRIIDGVKAGEFHAPFKGVAIGNGMLSFKDDANSVIRLLYYRGEIGYQEWEELNMLCCDNSTMPCDYYTDHMNINGQDAGDFNGNVNDTCGQKAAYYASVIVGHTLNDGYNQYQDCYSKYKVSQLAAGLQIRYPKIVYPLGDTEPDLARLINYDSTDPEWGFSCWQDTALAEYLNTVDVQKAIHAYGVTPNLTAWAPCNDWLNMKGYSILYQDMHAQFTKIIQESDANILVYNGDVDSMCNFLGDEWFVRNSSETNDLNGTDRQPWLFRGQIAGYIKNFGGRIDLLTVKGSGHFVPLDRAGPSLQMISNFFLDTKNYSEPSPYDTTLKALFTNPTAKPKGAGHMTASLLVATLMATLAIFI